eukprot:gi/632947763/ref/XP_007889213.1/ PREDICTED: uncharacterized protein LOC103177062 [Callorhinchus milii]
MVFNKDLWKSCLNSKLLAMETPELGEDATDRTRCARLVLKKTGAHPGAEELWKVLRDHSISKLKKLDEEMPKDHKTILAIYARDCLTKEHPNPQTSCFKKEWPVLPALKSSRGPQNKISTPISPKTTQFAGEHCRFLTAKDIKSGYGFSKRYKKKKLPSLCYSQSPKPTTNQKLLKTNEKPMGCSYIDNIPIALKGDIDPCSGPFIHNW